MIVFLFLFFTISLIHVINRQIPVMLYEAYLRLVPKVKDNCFISCTCSYS